MNSKFWVTMTDKFLSGWGHADHKTNKLVIECESMNEAKIVYLNALRRHEMKYVNIVMNKPYYNKRYNFTSYHSKADYSSWFTYQSDWN
jgi:hypothetical protein